MRLARASMSGYFTLLLFLLGLCGTFSSNWRTATRNFSRSRSGNALTFLSNSTALTTIKKAIFQQATSAILCGETSLNNCPAERNIRT
jgi:hypothetical protein